MRNREDNCALCARACPGLTRHHLLPQCRHRKPRFQRFHTLEEGRERIALLCKACHSFVHSVLTEKELEQQYDTIERLQKHEAIGRFAKWIQDKPPGFQPLSRKRKNS